MPIGRRPLRRCAPLSGERRDNSLELQVKSVIGTDLKFEPDLARWFPVWGAPGL